MCIINCCREIEHHPEGITFAIMTRKDNGKIYSKYRFDKNESLFKNS